MSPSPSITVVHLSGELELSRREEIRTTLTIHGNESAILIDFSDVTYADSTALAELLRFYGDSAKSNVPVALLINSRQFARVIEYAGLSQAFKIFNDRSEALVYLAEQRS